MSKFSYLLVLLGALFVFLGCEGGGDDDDTAGDDDDATGDDDDVGDDDTGDDDDAAPGGTERWRYDCGAEVVGGPTIENGVVYAVCGEQVAAVDAATGLELWTAQLPAEPLATACLPVVDGAMVFLIVNNVVYALDATNGDTDWTFAGTAVGDDIPDLAPLRVDGDVVYGAFGPGNVYALDATTGDLIWEQPHSSEGVETQPAVFDDVLYYGKNMGALIGRSIDDGALVSTWNADDNVDGSPLVFQGNIYFGSDDGVVHAHSGESGEELWSEAIGEVYISGRFAPLDGAFAVVSKYEGFVVALDYTDGTVRWTWENERQPDGKDRYRVGIYPASIPETVFISSEQGALVALSATDGEVLWDFSIGEEIWTSSNVDEENGQVVFGTMEGTVILLE